MLLNNSKKFLFLSFLLLSNFLFLSLAIYEFTIILSSSHSIINTLYLLIASISLIYFSKLFIIFYMQYIILPTISNSITEYSKMIASMNRDDFYRIFLKKICPNIKQIHIKGHETILLKGKYSIYTILFSSTGTAIISKTESYFSLIEINRIMKYIVNAKQANI